MKKYSLFIILVLFLVNSSPVSAQDKSEEYKNRVCLGFGGEDGFVGIDYSRDIYRSKIFLGIGCGLGTGWIGYVRYEPCNWRLSPFVSSGLSYSFGGTLIVSPGTSVFFTSAGLNYSPKVKRRMAPTAGIGITYYSILAGDAEGGMNGFGPSIKFGIAFLKKAS